MPKKPNKPKRVSKIVAATENSPPPRKIPSVTVTPEVDEDGWGDDGLTIRQRSFVTALIGPAGGNATKAAEMAGYRADNYNALKVTAHENLTKPNVQRAIGLATAKRNLTPEWVKNRLAELASSNLANFIDISPEGVATPNMMKAFLAGAMGQLKELDLEAGKIKVHDPTHALNTLAKIHGLLKDDNSSRPDTTVRVRRRRAKDADA